MRGLVENRNVHYSLGVEDGVNPDAIGERRAGTIVKVVDDERGVVHLHVHLVPEDLAQPPYRGTMAYPATIVLLRDREYSEGEEPGKWRWMDRA